MDEEMRLENVLFPWLDDPSIEDYDGDHLSDEEREIVDNAC